MRRSPCRPPSNPLIRLVEPAEVNEPVQDVVVDRRGREGFAELALLPRVPCGETATAVAAPADEPGGSELADPRTSKGRDELIDEFETMKSCLDCLRHRNIGHSPTLEPIGNTSEITLSPIVGNRVRSTHDEFQLLVTQRGSSHSLVLHPNFTGDETVLLLSLARWSV